MKILIVANWFEPAVAAGGPVRSLANLVDELSETDEVQVLAHDRDLDATEPFPGLSGKTVSRGSALVTYVNKFNTPALYRSIRHVARRGPYDVAVLPSVWDPISRKVALAIGLRAIKAEHVILMPRGELSQGALSIKSTKKRVLGPAIRRLYAGTVDAIAVTSEAEADDARRWLPGVRVIRTSNAPDRITFCPQRLPGAAAGVGALRLVFISRVNEKKGLLEFLRGLEALGHVAEFPDVGDPIVNLDVYGLIEGQAYWQACQQVMARLPATITVTYGGVLSRGELESTLHGADASVLLTADENYGHAIAESLQAGTPIFTTPATPWTDAVHAGGGWIVNDRDDADAIASAVQQLIETDAGQRQDMRRRARFAFESFQASQPGNPVAEMFN